MWWNTLQGGSGLCDYSPSLCSCLMNCVVLNFSIVVNSLCAGFKKPKRESKEREKEVPVPSQTDSPRRGVTKQPVGNGDTASGNSSASEKVDKIKVMTMICLWIKSSVCLSACLSVFLSVCLPV